MCGTLIRADSPNVTTLVVVRAGSVLSLLGWALLLPGCPQLLQNDFQGVAASQGPDDSTLDASTAPRVDAGSRPPILVADAGSEALDASAPPVGADPAPPASVASLRAALAHRYSFDGIGYNPLDSLGGDPAYIYNGTLADEGYVHLTGGDEYVSLPNGVLSSTSNKTIEAWLTWGGGLDWQRIFDFGVSSAGEFEQGVGSSYLYLTPSSNLGVMTVGCSQNGLAGEVRLAGTVPLPIGVLTHVAVVVDSTQNMLYLYIDGALVAGTPLSQRLGGIEDTNVWIGHSQYAADPNLSADVTEFRIYDDALGADQLALSYRLGPDALLSEMP